MKSQKYRCCKKKRQPSLTQKQVDRLMGFGVRKIWHGTSSSGVELLAAGNKSLSARRESRSEGYAKQLRVTALVSS